MHVGQEEQLLTANLLGELPAEQKAEIEERCGLDGDLFDRLLARRDSLIDDYLGDRLPALQRHHPNEFARRDDWHGIQSKRQRRARWDILL